MPPLTVTGRTLTCIGLGGIAEGWLYPLLLFHQTGILPFELILLVDGKSFARHNQQRQLAAVGTNKASHRCQQWLRLFPEAPLRHLGVYVDANNVGALIPDGAVVLLSPDNHVTRKLVSDHVCTLDNALLIVGGNDAIDEASGATGVEAMAMVHYKVKGQNLTPPITAHHPEIASPTDHHPATAGCMEAVMAGQPQVLATNLLAGQLMIQLLHRYCSLPSEQATTIVEVWGQANADSVTPYGLDLRPVVV